jgi:hypothetical protein
MVYNFRDPRTLASIHPQYNLLSVVYRLYVQIFERIEHRQFPPYIETYMERNGVTWDRVLEQQRLIADMFDGLLAQEHTWDSSLSYLRKAMQDTRWHDRFDWEAMAVFDMLANQALFAYAYGAIADLVSAEDITAMNAGELREIVDRLCRRAADFGTENPK